MRKLTYWIVCLSILSVGLKAHAEVALSAKNVENRLAVVFTKGTTQAQKLAIVKEYDLPVIRELNAMNIFIVEATPEKIQKNMIELKNHPRVFHVSKDFYVKKWIEATPEAQLSSLNAAMNAGMKNPAMSMPKFKTRGLQNIRKLSDTEIQWGIKRVNAPAAWSTNQGAGVKVAVVDTGIDPNHPDLQVVGGYNAIDKDDKWADDHSHGTHVAGIIAAAMNDKMVVGVAPKAQLYAVKVLTKEGSGSLFGILGGMNWCVENKIDVANMSLGSAQGNFLFEYGVQTMINGGVALIAAAGNDGKAVNYPAAYAGAIAVSALCPPGVTNAKLCANQNEGIAAFSSRGPQVAFIAPGVLIPSTVPLFADASGVKAYSGTSMATPHVAGLAALAVSKGAKGAQAVRSALNAAAEKLPNLSSEEQGSGLINAAKLAK